MRQLTIAVLVFASAALAHAQQAGAHTWMVWRRYLNEVAPLLLK